MSKTLMKVDDGFNYQATLGSRNFSYAVSGFGQVIESFRFEDGTSTSTRFNLKFLRVF